MRAEICKNHIVRLFLLPLIFWGIGCVGNTPPVQYYVLNPVLQGQTDAQSSYRGDFSIGVGPVEIPEILDRPHIVTRTDENRVAVAEYHRWGGSFKTGITEYLVQELSVLLKTYRVYSFPWRNIPAPDYRILLTIHRFDGNLGGEVVLDVSWAIDAALSKKILTGKRSTFKTVAKGTAYSDYVAAESRVLSDLGRELAVAIDAIK